MKGLDKFATHFKDYTDQYIMIGGAACGDLFEEQGVTFRRTDDLDLILVVEALNDSFIEHFWKFIREGKYERNEAAEEKQYYRFINPQTADFPVQVELFSRTPDVIQEKEGMRFTPIPTDEDISSLSAILMDDEYYTFTLAHTEKNGILSRADDLALICLKAKAFLDLSKRKADGEHVDSKDIKKHKNDVFRLASVLPRTRNIQLPENIRVDIISFIANMEENLPDTAPMLKAMGIGSFKAGDLIGQLKRTFNLQESEK
ncbi:MAG: hypothetical protein WEA56_05630 [Balneolaceae bacterium]